MSAEGAAVILSLFVVALIWLADDRMRLKQQVRQLRREKAIRDAVDSIWLPTVGTDLYNKRVELIDTIARTYPKE